MNLNLENLWELDLQQQTANMNNYNMLPLPNLLVEGATPPGNKSGSVPVQYMSSIPPSELRHTNPSRTSFFGGEDMEHSIDELSGATDNRDSVAPPSTTGGTAGGTSGSDVGNSSVVGTTAATTASSSGGDSSQSDAISSTSPGDDKAARKRKQDENSSKNSISLGASDIPKYKLERSLKSIGDIWKEYEYGLNDKPPLKLLEIKYGTKWRNDTESRTFLRRKKIYDAIENGKTKGYSEEQVIQELEDYRSYEHNGSIRKKPLSWLNANMPEKYET
ncbi:High-osmolarity-induced transcription protein 1 [Spathaspora sp. JA1]|nr:High-osmolarity-induced transcription protein 1 [Spathaspora sp. JA1]